MLALVVGLLLVMVVMRGGDEDDQQAPGDDLVTVVPTPVATPTPGGQATPVPTATAAVTPTPSPIPTPSPTPSPTPDTVGDRLARFRTQYTGTDESSVLVGIWASTIRLLSEAPESRHAEIYSLADNIAAKVTRNPPMLTVRDGRFTMGRDDASMDQRPSHLVMLNEYQIGQFEVSALEFATFLNANKDRAPLLFQPTADTTVELLQDEDRYAPKQGMEFHAANGVSWHAAQAYAEWLADTTGKNFRLPTEAEWERAAAGTERSLYPWGNSEPDATKAIYNSNGPVRVDSFSAFRSPVGAYNMAGNVAEWVSDWFLDTAYSPGVLRTNPTGPAEPSGVTPRKVLRGGNYLERPDDLTTSRRQRDQPDKAEPFYGFRLALTP